MLVPSRTLTDRSLVDDASLSVAVLRAGSAPAGNAGMSKAPALAAASTSRRVMGSVFMPRGYSPFPRQRDKLDVATQRYNRQRTQWRCAADSSGTVGPAPDSRRWRTWAHLLQIRNSSGQPPGRS